MWEFFSSWFSTSSCTWLGDSSLRTCFLPLGLASAFCPSSNSLSYLAYIPNCAGVSLSSHESYMKPRTSASEPTSKFCLFNVFQAVNDYFFCSCPPASYSQPILSGPIRNSDSTEEEVTFSCRSGNGYPEPNVYWINKTDNSHLPPSELKISRHTDGTYSVFSTLKVKATSNMQIECSIENRILQENLSANCKSHHDTSCFLDSRYINQHVSVCSYALTRATH